MRPNPSAVALAVLLGALMIVWVLPAQGQTTGCPGGADCEDASDFDADADGWLTSYLSASWVADTTVGVTSAAGVLKLYNMQLPAPQQSMPGIYKIFYLQPGQYQVRLRAAQDPVLALDMRIWVVVDSVDVISQSWSDELSTFYFSNYTTSAFTLYSPQLVKIKVLPEQNNVWIDYIYLEALSSAPTATPIAPTVTPGGPTLTPRPTWIPVEQQATPAPPGTAVCQDAPVALPTYATTATAAYTGTTFGILDTFGNGPVRPGTLPWTRLGNATISTGNDHAQDGSGAAILPYDPHWNETTMGDFDEALVLDLDYGYTIWVNAWAQADVVPTGGTAKMELWQNLGGTWELVEAVQISAQYWYPIHAEISASALGLAFTATRSDTPAGGYAVLDDVYLYAPEANRPYCDGGYPPGTVGYADPDTDLVYLLLPGDKPCPGGIMQPNNLWGMLLAQLTIWLDQQMAWSPAHVLGTTRDLAQQFMLGPLGAVILIATLILDWQVPIIMLQVYLAFQGGLALIGVWKTIRRAFLT